MMALDEYDAPPFDQRTDDGTPDCSDGGGGGIIWIRMIAMMTRQSEMADLARRATRWVGTLSDGNVHVKFHDDRLRNGGDITY